MSRPRTLGELKAAGWRSRSVKDELRANAIARLRSGEPLFPGIVGYENTVEPQIVNALLSKHDFILLGLRGQAKTRILRSLAQFLDEWVPAIDGCPLNSDPYGSWIFKLKPSDKAELDKLLDAAGYQAAIGE